MKRSKGFKIEIPLVISSLQHQNIPVIICSDKISSELIIKPGSSFHIHNSNDNEWIISFLHKYILKNKPLPAWQMEFKLRAYSDINSLSKENLLSGILIALMEENILFESKEQLIEYLNSLDLTEINLSVVKTMITGGIVWSKGQVHERIFSAAGMFVHKVKGSDFTCKEDEDNVNKSIALITGLLKDKHKLIQSYWLGRSIRKDGSLLAVFKSEEDKINYCLTSRSDIDEIISFGEVIWSAGINKEGAVLL